ncbi:unnamed protein product [Cuscuta epithymum]|uniref:Uncharacterized protein n=1 Tax=Cuscuta epithymum TaxID=186058 RepID=A0AAV0DLI8_9ASTE|nr:unnamed protein product [Cuscuta epithymum]
MAGSGSRGDHRLNGVGATSKEHTQNCFVLAVPNCIERVDLSFAFIKEQIRNGDTLGGMNLTFPDRRVGRGELNREVRCGNQRDDRHGREECGIRKIGFLKNGS